jgi:hypothetical protein
VTSSGPRQKEGTSSNAAKPAAAGCGDIALVLSNVPQLAVSDQREISEPDIERMASECRQRWNLGTGPIADVFLVMENAGVCALKEAEGS